MYNKLVRMQGGGRGILQNVPMGIRERGGGVIFLKNIAYVLNGWPLIVICYFSLFVTLQHISK